MATELRCNANGRIPRTRGSCPTNTLAEDFAPPTMCATNVRTAAHRHCQRLRSPHGRSLPGATRRVGSGTESVPRILRPRGHPHRTRWEAPPHHAAARSRRAPAIVKERHQAQKPLRPRPVRERVHRGSAVSCGDRIAMGRPIVDFENPSVTPVAPSCRPCRHLRRRVSAC